MIVAREMANLSWTDPIAHFQGELDSLPLITVGVLSYNRINDLRGTLDVLTQGTWYPHTEIIVIDNASTDGSAQMVKAEFPTVPIITLPNNAGEVARNIFFRKARGKYFFSFDDDSFPGAPYTLLRAVEFLEKNQDVHALCFECFQPRSNFRESSFFEKYAFQELGPTVYQGVYYIEGAMGFRTEIFKTLRGYDDDFFFGALGLDLALEMYKNNFQMVYYPDLLCLHMRSAVSRDSQKGFYFNTRNFLWTLFKHFPLWCLPVLVLLYIIRRLIICLKRPGLTISFLRGLKDALLRYRPQRKKTSKLSSRQIMTLKRWFLFLYRW